MQNSNALKIRDFERADWQEHAACRGKTNEFFLEGGKSIKDAVAVCAACPVREDCLCYALRNEERFGVWGGLSPQQRQRLKRA